MLEGRRYPLHLSDEQQRAAASFAAAARLVFNLAREQREAAQRLCQKPPGYAAQCRDLTELRAEVDWLRAVPVHVCQQAIRDCHVAYQRFFSGVSSSPGWRKKSVNDSFRFPDPTQIGLRPLSHKWCEVRLPKLGWCRFRWTQPLDGEVRNVTVSRDRTGQWWASSCVDTNRRPAPPNGRPAIGVDRGVVRAYQTSDGEDDYFEVPRLRRKEAERLRRLERRRARQRKGSRRRCRTIRQIAVMRRRERNRRWNALHQATSRLAREHGLISIERLDVKAMSASARGTVEQPSRRRQQKRGLNREILACGWGQFRLQLAYKSLWYGSRLVEVPAAFTSRSCSLCKHVAEESRESQAVFRCRACGYGPINADYNAAMNIRERGMELASAAGRVVAARGASGNGRAGKREPRSGSRTIEAA